MKIQNSKFKIQSFVLFFAICNLQLAICNCFSQNLSQTFNSSKLRINDYGSREQTATLAPSVVTINLKDSLITVTSEHQRVNDFLNYQNQFEISRGFGSSVTRVYLTTGEYVFTFDAKLRAIIISKRDISPQVHSVWLEAIEEAE